MAATTIPDPGRIRGTPCPLGGFGLAKCAFSRCPRSTSNNPPSPSSSATYHAPRPAPSRSPRPACCLPRLGQPAVAPAPSRPTARDRRQAEARKDAALNSVDNFRTTATTPRPGNTARTTPSTSSTGAHSGHADGVAPDHDWRGGSNFEYRREGHGFEIAHVRPFERTDSRNCWTATGDTGARRAIPRRIHGVRLAVCTAIPRCLGCVWIRRAPVGRRRRRRLPTPYG